MAVLITGVGYIGSTVLGRLLQQGEQVVGLESFYCTPRSGLAPFLEHPCFTLVEGDVAEPRDVARAFDLLPTAEPPVVFHLAAQPSAALAARDADYTERTNLTGARVLLAAAQQRGARVVFGGSFRVYGDELASAVVDEETPYGRVGDLSHLSKLYVEQLGRMLGLPFVSVRLGITYGLAPIMKHDPSFMTVPNLFARRAARGEPLHVLDDRPMGFVHVEDAARALLVAAQLVGQQPWQAVNAAPEVYTIGQVAELVRRLAAARGRAVQVEGVVPSGAKFEVRSRLETAGFRAQYDMEQGLGPVLDHFLEHPH